MQHKSFNSLRGLEDILVYGDSGGPKSLTTIGLYADWEAHVSTDILSSLGAV